MRYLVNLLLLAVPGLAATTCVVGPIYKANGDLASGTVTVSWQTFVAAGNKFVPAGSLTSPIVNGSMNICLEPNDVAYPSGTSYRVQFSLYSLKTPIEYWVVPVSASPLRVDQVRVSGPVTPNVMIGITQLLGGSAVPGQILAWNGSSWIPQNLSGVSVSSFNGRGGAIVPEAGDYSFSQISGVAAVTQGGTGTATPATPGSVFFAGANGVFTTDSGMFFWNAASRRLGLGNSTPAYTLDVTGDTRTSGTFYGAGFWTTQDGGGEVALGRYSASDPTARLNVLDTAGGANNPVALLLQFAGVERFRFTADGKLGIGMAPEAALDVTGQIRASGGILFGDASTLTTGTLAGDVTGAIGATTVAGLQGRAVASTVPAPNQVLAWNGTQWAPTEPASGLPAQGGQGGKVLTTDGTAAHWESLVGGDLSGALPNLTVSKIQGRAIASIAPANAQVLAWNEGTSQWEPQNQGSASDGANVGSGAYYWFYQKSGSTLQFYSFDVTAPLTATLAGNKITFAIPQANGTTSGYLASGDWAAFNAKVSASRAINTGTGLTGGGDLSADRSLSVVADSTTQRIEVSKGGTLVGTRKRLNLIQGANVSLTVADNSVDNAVDVTIEGSSGVPNYGVTFTNQTTVSIPGSTHALGTSELLVSCYDNASPAKWIEPEGITIDLATHDVVIDFFTAQSGRCVLNGAAVGGNYVAAFSNETVVNVPGSVHNFRTANLIVQCYDNSSPIRWMQPSQVTVDPGSYDVVVSFASPQTGRCVINGSSVIAARASSFIHRAFAISQPLTQSVETTVYTTTIPGGAIGANGCAEVSLGLSVSANPGTTVWKLYFGGAELWSVTAAATYTDFRGVVLICNTTESSQPWIFSPTGIHTGASSGYYPGPAVARAVNTANATTFSVSATSSTTGASVDGAVLIKVIR